MADWNAGVGFIGLGKMGGPMAARLIAARPAVYINDVSSAAVDAAVARGGIWCPSPAELARNARTIVLMLPNSQIVEQVVLGSDGLASACRPGTLIVDMSSGDAVVTRRIAQALRNQGADIIDAPVSGGIAKATDGTLTIMAGGPLHLVEAARPLLAEMGTKIVHVGELGNGHIVKALNNFLYAASLLASAEALTVAKKLGVDPKTAVEVFTSSSGTNGALEHRIRNCILPRKLEPAMSAALMYKDLIHATNLGIAAQTPMAVASLVREQFCEWVASGHADDVDYGIVRKLEAVSKVEIP